MENDNADEQEEYISQDDIEELIDLDNEPINDEGDEANFEADMNDVIDDKSIGNFTDHNEAVLCCDVSKDDKLVVTGGQDDKAYVWETTTQTIKFNIDGHKDSVVAAKFNSNSSLVATGDLSGVILVYDLTGKRCYDFEIDDLNWLLWHPVADNVLLAGTKTGEAWMWKLSQTNPQCKTFQSYGSENICAKIFNDGKRITMGYEDGSVRIWDLKDANVISSITGLSLYKYKIWNMNLTI